MKRYSLIGAAFWLAASLQGADAADSFPHKAALGEALFNDVALSVNRSQACASCHMPDHGFVDARDNGVKGAASLGADGASLGDRNAPTAAYARFSPSFRIAKSGVPVGGQFHDGRAKTLAEQAGGPPLNPGEMALPSKATALARLQEQPAYVAAFAQLYGPTTLDKPETAYAAMTDAIAAFESTPTFAPFDSKYDRHLRGDYKLTPQEELGMTLFFSNQFTNCSQCHQLNAFGGAQNETFSNYEHHNIGVPINAALRAANKSKPGLIDHGTMETTKAKAHDGRFKTPTLRNVAVTGPYMHNGVFQDLKTVILFYNKYNSKAPTAQINPETGKDWGAPEVSKTISVDKLKAPALDEKRIDALVAFLKTLTDARYEHLLQ